MDTNDLHDQNTVGNMGLGSYYWGDFRENNSELIRLKKQARIVFEVLEKDLWNEIPIKHDGKILDLGCGPGIISSELAKFCSYGSVVGMDKNELMIKECCKDRNYTSISNLSFKLGDIYDLHIEESSIDMVYTRFLFQHLSNPIKALNEVRRILKPGGKVCIIDVDDDWLTLNPRPSSFESYLERVQHAQNSYGGDRFVGSRLEGYLKENGFKNIVARLKMLDTDLIPIRELLDLTINYKYQLISEKDIEIAQQERQNIMALADHKFAWGAVGVFIAIGEK